MNEFISVLETEIALQSKHLAEDEARITDPILGQFFLGRAAVEKRTLETLKRLWDIVNKLQ